jgi:hypothetical protein
MSNPVLFPADLAPDFSAELAAAQNAAFAASAARAHVEDAFNAAEDAEDALCAAEDAEDKAWDEYLAVRDAAK